MSERASASTRQGDWRLAAAVVLPLLGIAEYVATILFEPESRQTPWLPALVFVLVGVSGVVSFLILRAQRHNRIGWLLALHSFFVGSVLSTPPPSDQKWIQVVGQLNLGAWLFLYVCLVFIAYVFPDGRFLSRRWRRWVGICVLGYVAFLVGATYDRGAFQEEFPGVDPPLGTMPEAVSGAIGAFGFLMVAASLVGAVVCARARLRRSAGEERLRLLWFTAAALSIPAMLATCALDWALFDSDGPVTVAGIAVFGSMIPVCIGIAILRTNLFDIELVLSRALTYSALTIGVVGTYSLVLWTTGMFLDRRSASGLIGVGVVAVAIQPVHSRLRRRVERWVYGDRSEPGVAVRRLADRVESADPNRILDSVTEAVADALKVDRVLVELIRDGVPLHGDHVVRVPLVHRGERLGDLAVDVPPGRQLSPADVALLHDLARHAGVVVSAVQLAQDLQASRAALVTAREEERRRLRRDLHDGVGPSLAAIVLKLNAAERRTDPEARKDILAETREEARAAIAEVRRLVDDLRPPAIDEVGLVGAIRQRVASLASERLAVDLRSPAALPLLPAAVEVAAFRIATEAVTNVARHSTATRCVVRIAIDGAFELSVSDNGDGAAPGTRPGVGWTSMAQRAEELGGSCTITSRPEGGLLVRAVIPLQSPATISSEVRS